MKYRPRENEEPSGWYGVSAVENLPDDLFFADGTATGPLDRYELRHAARLIRRMTGDMETER